MTIVTQMMLIFLIVCAIAVCLTRNLLTSVIIYMGDARNEVRRAHERQEKDGGADNGNA